MARLHRGGDSRAQNCCNCPRECGADRREHLGYCRTGKGFDIGAICLHRGEEPVVSGSRGICNIFFNRCNLQCVYCQNHQISCNHDPHPVHALRLPEVVARIESVLNQGTRRVGFVSPSHVLDQMTAIMEALQERGLDLVYVMNTNAFDKVDRLAGLQGRIQVYLPDLKYADSRLAGRYSDAPAYPGVAQQAVKEMFRQMGPDLELDEEGAIRRGLIIRHLVLPGQVENSKQCLRFIARELSTQVHVSVMAQYHPTEKVAAIPELNRRLTREEYEEVLDELHTLGLSQGWVQDLESTDHYVPDFEEQHPFENPAAQ